MNLKEWLLANHMTYEAGAEFLEEKPQTIERIATGKAYPSRNTAKAIVEMTEHEVDLYDLYDIERPQHH